MRRRGFLAGFAAALAAPAIIRTPGLLMPVRRPLFAPTEILILKPRGAGLSTMAQLSAITRAAFVPSLFVQIYQSHPLLNLWMTNAQAARGLVGPPVDTFRTFDW